MPHPLTSPPPQPSPSPHRRPGLAFAVINGSTFAVHVLLVCTTDVMAAPHRGGTGFGVTALLLQTVLLVVTAARFDRSADVPAAQGDIPAESRPATPDQGGQFTARTRGGW
ncbi:hypothetical protein [Streptomyces sp. NPDC047434]|uniref:hypothetical protein n=1 Tax=Streptomyces sp. NPDC047434 TaxID=3155143 RepID=UPI0033D731BB